jgi:hypothetical protein
MSKHSTMERFLSWILILTILHTIVFLSAFLGAAILYVIWNFLLIAAFDFIPELTYFQAYVIVIIKSLYFSPRFWTKVKEEFDTMVAAS